MSPPKDQLILRLYEALNHLSLGIDDIRRSSMRAESHAMLDLGGAAREVRPLLHEACRHLMQSGYRWDGTRFVPGSQASSEPRSKGVLL